MLTNVAGNSTHHRGQKTVKSLLLTTTMSTTGRKSENASTDKMKKDQNACDRKVNLKDARERRQGDVVTGARHTSVLLLY